MKEIDTFYRLLEIIISTVENVSSAVNKSDILKLGHFNGSIFRPSRMLRCKTSTWYRFLINVAPQMGEKQFKKMMEDFADRLWEIANDDELLDDINSLHDFSHREIG